ncbi:uncharacterized protein LOC144158373 isoform X2 [Haemaphysalis longicornis]
MPNSCVPAMATGGACSQNLSCSRQTQATIATNATGDTAIAASMPHTTLSVPRSCVVALSLDAACSQSVCCSHYTQTANTTSTIGTQCSLTSLISAGSQTKSGLAALEVNNTQVGDSGASDNNTTSRDGADILAELSPHTSSSGRHSGNTGPCPVVYYLCSWEQNRGIIGSNFQFIYENKIYIQIIRAYMA